MMKRLILAGLLAATAAVPAAAQDIGIPGDPGVRNRGDQTEPGMREERRQARAEARAQAEAGLPAPPRWQDRGARAEGSAQASVGEVRVQPGGFGAGQGRMRDRDGDGVPNWRDRDRDGDGIVNRRDVDRNGDGAPDWRRRDRDGDGIVNRRDIDRDGDGIVNRRDIDRNGDGRVDPRFDRNRDGRADRGYDRNRDGRVDRGYDWDRNGRINSRFGQRYGTPRDGYGYDNGRFGQRWNRGWRNDWRYDWQRYRTYNRGLYSLPRYYDPYGYRGSYQRFSIGIRLNSLFFGSRYLIDDPYRYRLPEAYGQYRWVRYYNDALLVDVYDGTVVDAIYDFFY